MVQGSFPMYNDQMEQNESYYSHVPAYVTQIVKMAPSKLRMIRIVMVLSAFFLVQFVANAQIESFKQSQPEKDLTEGGIVSNPRKRTPSESVWIVTPIDIPNLEHVEWSMDEDLDTLKTEPTRLGVLTHIFLANPLLFIALTVHKVIAHLTRNWFKDEEERDFLMPRRWIVEEFAEEERRDYECRKKFGDRSVTEYLAKLRTNGGTLEDALNEVRPKSI